MERKLEIDKLDEEQQLLYGYYMNNVSRIKKDTKDITLEFIEDTISMLSDNALIDLAKAAKAVKKDVITIVKQRGGLK